MHTPHKPIKPNGCWGGMKYMWDCDKKPRDGCLTCWWHRHQESQAKRLKARLENKK